MRRVTRLVLALVLLLVAIHATAPNIERVIRILPPAFIGFAVLLVAWRYTRRY